MKPDFGSEFAGQQTEAVGWRELSSNHAGCLDDFVYSGILRAGVQLRPCMSEAEVTG